MPTRLEINAVIQQVKKISADGDEDAAKEYGEKYFASLPEEDKKVFSDLWQLEYKTQVFHLEQAMEKLILQRPKIIRIDKDGTNRGR